MTVGFLHNQLVLRTSDAQIASNFNQTWKRFEVATIRIIAISGLVFS